MAETIRVVKVHKSITDPTIAKSEELYLLLETLQALPEFKKYTEILNGFLHISKIFQTPLASLFNTKQYGEYIVSLCCCSKLYIISYLY